MEIENKILNLTENEKFNLALKLLEKEKNNIQIADYCFLYGEILRIQGFFQKAIYYYKKALPFDLQKDRKLDILNKICATFRAIGNKKNAKKYSAFAIKFAMKNKLNIAQSMLEKAMTYRLCGEYDKAIKIFKNIEKTYHSKKDYQGLSYISWAMGGIYRLTGNFAKSIQCFQNSYKIASKIKDKDLKLYSLFGLAGALRVSGDIDKSYQTYKKARAIVSKNDYFGLAYSYCGMANSLRQKGELKKAKSFYLKSLKLYKAIDDKPDLGFVYWGLGEIYKKENNNKKALSYFNIANKLFESGQEKRGEILNDISISHIKYLNGETKEAKKIFLNAIKKAKKERLNTYLEIFT